MLFATALMQTYYPLWLTWLGMFLVVEFSALFLRKKYPDVNNNGGTFSELVWWAIRGKRWPHRAAFVVLLGFFIDLGFHFFIGSALY
jgi:hypothetical protein